jgi:hypothetical protein
MPGASRAARPATHRDALAGSGIAGTTIRYRFFWPTARWLAHRWPAQFRLDRNDGDAEDNIAGALPLVVSPAEAQWLREREPEGYDALDALRGHATDAAWLVRSIESMPGDTFTRESFYDGLDPSCELVPGRGTPTRTLDRHVAAPAAFRAAPLRRGRPDLREEIRRPPRTVRVLGPREGARIVELARGAMITRKRDLDAFAYGDARDVRLVDDGHGLAFALVGVVPERRTLCRRSTARSAAERRARRVLAATCSAAPRRSLAFRPSAGEAAYANGACRAGAHLFGVTSYNIGRISSARNARIETSAWWFIQDGVPPRAATAGSRAAARAHAGKRAPPLIARDAAPARRMARVLRGRSGSCARPAAGRSPRGTRGGAPRAPLRR